MLAPDLSLAQANASELIDRKLPVLADQHFLDGLKQFNAGQPQAAMQSWQQALKIYQAIGDRPSEGKTLHELGYAYYSLSDYEQAIPAYQQSLAIAKELGDRQQQSKLLERLGDAYYYQQNDSQAIGHYRASLALLKQGELQRGWFAVYRLGEIYLKQKGYDKAAKYYEQSLAIAQEKGDRDLQNLALQGLGLAAFQREDYSQAIRYLEQSWQISQALNQTQAAEGTLYLLGFSYYWLNDYAKAISYYEQSLATARQASNQASEQLALGGLGTVYFLLGDYARALEFHQQSLDLAVKAADQKNQAVALVSLATDYYFLNDPDQAIALYQQALAVARSHHLANIEGNALSGLGQLYFEQADYPKAIEFYQQGLAIFRQIGNRYNESNLLRNLGGVYFQQANYRQAMALQRQSLALSQASADPYGQAQALTNLGATLFKLGKLKQSEASFRAAIDRFESIRQKLGDKDEFKISISETHTSPYIGLQKVLVDQNKPIEALEIAERGRARSFVELLNRRLQAPAQPAPPSLTQIRQIAQKQQATLVEYGVFDTVLYIWVVQPTGQISFRQVDLQPLQQQESGSLSKLIQEARSSIIAGYDARPELQQLSQLLIQPIADLLPINPEQPVVLIPQADLFLLPFPALIDASGTALVEQHTILTAPSIQALGLTQALGDRLASQTTNTLIVGNPTIAPAVMQQYRISPLPFAAQEANDIAQLIGGQPLIGDQATKAAIVQQMSQARKIHLATHGILDDQQGLASAVVLAPAGASNGLLTASEILDLDLKAELVVLSACNTGRGRITGDGVIGLSRALIAAGVPSVVVSLWSVRDDSTAFLMTEFYKHLKAGYGKAQALRQAMLITIKKYPNPKAWSAFTLIGQAN
ncbi:MAG: tetratricopeptide repeat protein [Aphanocapsa sp. GSE-SYN-MK-11-07L]|jgi:CHAT domain-containing protein/tetratricopeptide (TPR) repeat protein|nr:tetratricopeptide repeat protein [Aphanocapsa sp. GSE-SYN-MK-11-07L]